ncbi:hypothetical protein [Actinoplanes sp. TFC3]|uniref:hypothetical protein n=1 Tax=Actinoplanes sp. TFC3 TaxID=1710355 RepID=UPI0008335644|nr:hypothetical protein [Actinoplanes sp. TFC3]
MSEIPWWGLPLVAVVFALVGAGVTVLVSARNNYARSRAKRTKRWYAERRDAYVALLTQFERASYRLRTALDSGQPMPGPYTYLDEAGPAVMHVRLLASGQVRSAALAVHLLLEKLYTPKPTPPPGVDSSKAVREMLGHVPLVMQQLEAAIREELEIESTPPAAAVSDLPARSLRSYIKRSPGAAKPTSGSQESSVTS